MDAIPSYSDTYTQHEGIAPHIWPVFSNFHRIPYRLYRAWETWRSVSRLDGGRVWAGDRCYGALVAQLCRKLPRAHAIIS